MAEEDNDLKAMGIGRDLIRVERKERFEDHFLLELEKQFKVTQDNVLGRYSFQTNDYGVIDFYPKANKVLIRKLNKWIKPGLKWMIKQFNLQLKNG